MHRMNESILITKKDGQSSDDEVKVSDIKNRLSKVKKFKVEPEDESDIKDFAETTMNELLGWYGYDKVDSRDTQSLNLTVQRFTRNGSVGSAECGRSSANIVMSPPVSPHSNENSSSSDQPNGSEDSSINCAWCQKPGSKLFTLRTPTGTKTFCSELCFNQCRRASFKKYKICDWCKHVRHTVNYVDFQDGEQQLQFCSDKCLNQYKMHIFCKETQAHLQLHPHFQQQQQELRKSGNILPLSDGKLGSFNKKSSHMLITPELWLRDCKSDDAADECPISRTHSDDDSMSESIGASNVEPPRIHQTEETKMPLSMKKFSSSERHHRLRKLRDRERKFHSNRHSVLHPQSNRFPKVTEDLCSKHLSETTKINCPVPIRSPNPPSSAPLPLPPPPPHCLTSPHPPILPSSYLPLTLPPSHSESPSQPPIPFPGIQHLPPMPSSMAGHFPGSFLMGQSPPHPPPIPNHCHPRFPFPTGPLLPPATTMIPYPVMIPVPIPIPIPIPLPIREKNWTELMINKGLIKPNTTEQKVTVKNANVKIINTEDDTLDLQPQSSASVSPKNLHKIRRNHSDGNIDDTIDNNEENVNSELNIVKNAEIIRAPVDDEPESKRKCLRTRLSAK